MNEVVEVTRLKGRVLTIVRKAQELARLGMLLNKLALFEPRDSREGKNRRRAAATRRRDSSQTTEVGRILANMRRRIRETALRAEAKRRFKERDVDPLGRVLVENLALRVRAENLRDIPALLRLLIRVGGEPFLGKSQFRLLLRFRPSSIGAQIEIPRDISAFVFRVAVVEIARNETRALSVVDLVNAVVFLTALAAKDERIEAFLRVGAVRARREALFMKIDFARLPELRRRVDVVPAAEKLVQSEREEGPTVLLLRAEPRHEEAANRVLAKGRARRRVIERFLQEQRQLLRAALRAGKFEGLATRQPSVAQFDSERLFDPRRQPRRLERLRVDFATRLAAQNRDDLLRAQLLDALLLLVVRNPERLDFATKPRDRIEIPLKSVRRANDRLRDHVRGFYLSPEDSRRAIRHYLLLVLELTRRTRRKGRRRPDVD